MSEAHKDEEDVLDNYGASNLLSISSELIQHLPDDKRAEFLQAIAAFRLEIEHVEQYAGPIAHPGIVERWEAILPGSADRVLNMAEERQSASIELDRQDRQATTDVEKAIIRGVFSNHRQAMWLFVGLALVVVLAGTRIIELGHSAEGFAMIAGTACGVIVAFIKSFGGANSGNPNSDQDT